MASATAVQPKFINPLNPKVPVESIPEVAVKPADGALGATLSAEKAARGTTFVTILLSAVARPFES